mmetsp:Transcript_2763/g.9358  ORF Transcript_2763/g.9358 Transcript_2763/m.9358 type:complete len:232 (+) Transcript_2763:169-864(+)
MVTYSDDEEDEGQMPWDALGRGTPAGRALFALYNGDSRGAQVGNSYSDRNRMRITKQLESNPPSEVSADPADKELPFKKSKAKVAYPRFKPKREEYPRMRYIPPGKKPEHAIRAEMRQDEEEGAYNPPRPKGPVLGPEATARLQRMMEWKGKPPEDDMLLRRPTPVVKRKQTELEELEEMFEKVADVRPNSLSPTPYPPYAPKPDIRTVLYTLHPTHPKTPLPRSTLNPTL